VIRDHLTEDELAAAVQENLFDLFRSFEGLAGAELEETRTLSRHHAFPTNPMFKAVWNCRLPSEALDDAIDESLAWLRVRGAQAAFWWSGPGTRPDGLHERLEARGFAPFDVDAPGMVAELDALDWDALDRTPAGFGIERVQDDAGLEEWGRMFVAAHDAPAAAAQAWVDATLALGLPGAPWTHFVGRLDGEPVALATIVPGAGAAGAFAIGTVAAARGRGIGAAITLAAYAHAREQGYRYCVLFSTELGLPVYRRIGFRECGVGISRFLWRG
jgi:GNAT superfamily N-acetyltransferase